MSETLCQTVLRPFASLPEAHAGAQVLTPIDGLSLIRSATPSGIEHAISRPLACLVLQGRKQVTTGADTVAFGAGDSLLISADLPTSSQVTAAPYLSLVIDLDFALIAELVEEMRSAGANGRDADAAAAAVVRVAPTDAETADAAQRLLRLLDRPESIPVLHGALMRELHYWLLAGRHGAAIRRIGAPDSQARRVARAVALLRQDYARPLPVERLAAVAGMSPSSFHAHFRAVTSLSPLQFQKQLRLIEARRLMVAQGIPASRAAFVVGYESVPQFTREYRRLFGLPPGQDADSMRQAMRASAAA
ncbi:MAG: AraC family transcriptional regulator [Xanthomonadaceae bacterium]|nr:AraC family transcriptional regulator [Xanthomonadaceae bacterium]